MDHKPILFLDYDGVLHPDAAYLVNRKPELRAEGELFMWAPLLVEILDDFPSVKIVLSTSWVRELRFSRARNYLPEALQARVIGATWHSAMSFHPEAHHKIHRTWWDEATRYQQIKRFVERARLSCWVAIDDHPEGWGDEDRAHLIRTSGVTGLSELAIQDQLRQALKQIELKGHDL